MLYVLRPPSRFVSSFELSVPGRGFDRVWEWDAGRYVRDMARCFGNNWRRELSVMWQEVTDNFSSFKAKANDEVWSASYVYSCLQNIGVRCGDPVIGGFEARQLGPESDLGSKEILSLIEKKFSSSVPTDLRFIIENWHHNVDPLLFSSFFQKQRSAMSKNYSRADLTLLFTKSDGVLPDLVLPPSYPSALTTYFVSEQVCLSRLFSSHAMFFDSGPALDVALASFFSGRLEYVDALFPFRTKLDRGLRRSRIDDIYCIYRERRSVDLFFKVCRQCLFLDQILLSNVLYYHLVSPYPLDLSYALDSWSCVTTLRSISSSIKWRTSSTQRWFHELGVLGGYANPPWPNFDFDDEAVNLANGGGKFAEQMIPYFNKLCDFLVGPTSTSTPPAFDEWLNEGTWATSGSSDMGRVKVEVDGVDIQLKSKKNTVPDVISQTQLLDALSGEQKPFVAIKKAETGKIRIAVSAPLPGYLIQSYLTQGLDAFYTRTFAATLDEPADVTLTRTTAICSTIGNDYCLPFDYASFDHQPTQSMLVHMSEAFLRKARLYGDRCESVWIDHLRTSFSNPLMRAGDTVIPVTGGLMSGMRWTSAIGNVWNTVMTMLALSLPFCLCPGLEQIAAVLIRGDDTHVSGGLGFVCLTRVGFAVLGPDGNSEKFQILRGRSEFLRESLSDSGAWGNPVRAIPGLTQRKPWTDDPRDMTATLFQLLDAAKTIERRGGDVSSFSSVFISRWAERTGSDVVSASVPRVFGGLGIGESPKFWNPFTIVKHEQPKKHFTDMTTWRQDLLSEEMSAIGLSTDGVREAELEWDAMIPAATLGVKPKSRRVRWPRGGVRLLDHSSVVPDLIEKHPWFGKYFIYERTWGLVSLYARSNGLSAVKLFCRYVPGFYSHVVKLENCGFCRTDAIDILFGKAPNLVSVNLRDLLMKKVVEEGLWWYLTKNCTRLSGKIGRHKCYAVLQKYQDDLSNYRLKHCRVYQMTNHV